MEQQTFPDCPAPLATLTLYERSDQPEVYPLDYFPASGRFYSRNLGLITWQHLQALLLFGSLRWHRSVPQHVRLLHNDD